ncbi:putative metalloprotease CJM1_0395 family protein [Eionea flava]
MNINSMLPTAYTPNTLAAMNTLRSAVGEESTDDQQAIFSPIEQSVAAASHSAVTSEQPSEQADAQAQQVLNAERAAQQDSKEQQQEHIDQQKIQSLATLDREVRNHERAHAAVGGQYAGAPRYEYERGPDGVNYAVAGEVPISTGATSDPQMTIEKAQIIRRAALAPADPSAQDRKVAAEAVQMEAEARIELLTIEREQRIEEQRLQEAQREQQQQESRSTQENVIVSQTENTRNTSNVDSANVSREDSAVDDINEAQEAMFNELTEQLVAIGGAQQPAQSLGSIVSRFA